MPIGALMRTGLSRAILVVMTLYALMLPAAQGADAICAQVKIQIQQKLSFERQAFDAKMSIDNGLDIPVQNISINLNFKDASGQGVVASSDPNSTSALFFIAAPTLSAINAVDGTGTVAPKATGQIDWLLIPASGAGGIQPQGKLYFVGASLTYTVGSETKTVDVVPDTVTVLPQPRLTLDYFLASDVYADDPFTDEIEPPVPFTLGVRVKNSGGGNAAATTIESAQPKIVENKQGLLIGFQIIDSFINDQAADKTLLLKFGDVGPGASKVGRWDMVTTLSGRFVDFSATFTHSDSLGGALTSLIEAVNTHLLVHDVKVDLPGRDNVRDFLALDGNTKRVYESDSIDSVVTDQSTSAQFHWSTGSQYALSFPPTTGFAYVQKPDPKRGLVQPGAVMRSDGKPLPPENVWLSKKRNDDASWSYFINFFDVNTTGSYNVTLSDATASSSIAGKVFDDANGNGQQDSGEQGLGATAITLTGTDTLGASVNTIGYAEVGGAFKFVGLNPGTYALQVGAVQGYEDGTATAGTAGGTAGVASITTIALGADSNATGYAFAKRWSPAASAADVALTMTADVSSVKAGDSVTFQVKVSNNGPATATAVIVNDLLPSGLGFVSSSTTTGSYDSSTGVWTVGDLANAGTATLSLGAKVTRTTGLTNAATASSTTPDSNADNNNASVTLTPVAGTANLTLNLLESDYRIAAGQSGTLLAIVNNYGPDAATDVVIALAPKNVTLTSATPGLGSYEASAGLWTIDSLPSGASAALILHAADATDMSGLAASLSQIYGAPPSVPVTGQLTLNPLDCDCADLGLNIAVSTPTAAPGEAVDWVVTASNRGANPAPGTVAAISLPPGLTLLSQPATRGGYDAGLGIWTIGTVFPGDTATLTLRTTLNSASPVLMKGEIRAANTGLAYPDLAPADNLAQASVNAVASTAALSVSQTVDKLAPSINDTVTFTLTAGNAGPMPATGVSVADLLPAGLTFVSATPSQGAYDAQSGLWRVGALGVQGTATLTITAAVGTAAAVGNVALIVADQIDSNLVDNVARLYLNRKESDMTLALAADKLTSAPGQSVVVTVTAKNLGIDDASGVVVNAALPPGLSLTSANAAQGSYDVGTGLWKLGSLPANATAALTLTTNVNVAEPIIFLARVHEMLTHDGNTANNEAQLGLNPAADLVVSQSASSTQPMQGDTVVLTIAVTNSGPSTASAVTLTDLLPSGLTIVSDVTSVGTYINSTGLWTLGDLLSGATATLTLTARVTTSALVTNTAEVESATFDPNSGNNRASVTLTPIPVADLALSVGTHTPKPQYGSAVVLTIALRNDGPATALATRVTDVLPPGLTLVSAATTMGSYNPENGLWNVGDLSIGAAATLRIIARVATVSPVTNTASLVSSTFDPNAANNSASVTLQAAVRNGAATAEINLDVQQSVVRHNRLLVLVSCEDATGLNDPACLAAKTNFLGSYLGGQGFEYQIVSDPVEFQTSLRCGRYNTYWINGASAVQIDGIVDELQEAIYRGDGLVVDGVSAGGTRGFESILGANFGAAPSTVNATVNVAGADFSATSLVPVGAATTLHVTSGAAEGVFGSDSDSAALVSNQFGLGRSVTMGFALVDTLRAQTGTQSAATLLSQALQHVVPPDVAAYTGGALAVVSTTVRNTGIATNVELVATLPAGATAANIGPQAPTINGDQVSWAFPMAAGEVKTVDLGLRLPFVSGVHTVTMAVSSVRGSAFTHYGVYSYDLPVLAADRQVSQLVSDLQALNLSDAGEQQSRDAAIVAVQNAQYLAAISALDGITSFDVSGFLLILDRLLQESGRQWCTQLPACDSLTSPASATGSNAVVRPAEACYPVGK